MAFLLAPVIPRLLFWIVFLFWSRLACFLYSFFVFSEKKLMLKLEMTKDKLRCIVLADKAEQKLFNYLSIYQKT